MPKIVLAHQPLKGLSYCNIFEGWYQQPIAKLVKFALSSGSLNLVEGRLSGVLILLLGAFSFCTGGLMWVKIDDGFCTHPKLLTAGPLATLIQLRAICYSSQNQTDGFFPASAVALFLTGFDRLGIDDGKVGDYATFGYQADEIDWPAEMVKHGLWEPRDGGYYIHDYLKWNLSKKDRELFVKKKSAAGKKGMKSRWTKEKRIITPVITSAITDDITKPYHPISTSTLTPNLNLQSNSETEEFDKFWAAYPRKVGKKDARKAWDRAKDRPALPEILSAITRASQSKDWTKDNGDYIPHPATWLNQGRWDDDHTPTLTLTLNPHRPTKVVL